MSNSFCESGADKEVKTPVKTPLPLPPGMSQSVVHRCCGHVTTVTNHVEASRALFHHSIGIKIPHQIRYEITRRKQNISVV